MNNRNHTAPGLRFRKALLVCMPMIFLAGCSQDFASVDDVYVPNVAEERFPIQVLEMPVKMTVQAGTKNLPPDDVNRLVNFARAARDGTSSPVAVSYPAGSTKAKGASHQAVNVLLGQGVPRSSIQVSSYSGKSDVISLSFTKKVAATKQCGDWSENVAMKNGNEPFPNWGCTQQNNIAAMVANPEDFERPRAAGPAYAAGRMPGMNNYNSGAWTTPPSVANSTFSDFLTGN